MSVTEEHFPIFGRIVYFYASAEAGIKLILSAVLDQSVVATMVLTEPYAARSLRNVAKAIAKLKMLPDHRDEFLNLLGRYKQWSSLRNYIAHSRWTHGSMDGAIKPIYVEIRNDKPDTKGIDPSEKDFSIDDFKQAANDLLRLNNDIQAFMASSGISEKIAAKIEETRREIEALEGLSSMEDSSSPDETQP